MRIVQLCFTALILLACLYAGTLMWRASLLPASESWENRFSLPWQESNTSLLEARQLLSQPLIHTTATEKSLLRVLASRPLYAPAWLDFAEFARRNGQPEKAAQYLQYAQKIWPQRPKFLWRITLNLIKLGKIQLAQEVLAQYWIALPRETVQAVALVRRIESDDDRWLSTFFDTLHRSGMKPDNHYRQMLNIARRLRSPQLAERIWQYFPTAWQRKNQLLFPYLGIQLAAANYERASQIWLASTAANADQAVYNNSFEDSLRNGGFAWRAYKVPGVTIKRDRQEYYAGDYSLLTEFSGNKNPDFSHIRQRLILQPGRYRLYGYWKGYDVTTRSGVFIELYSLKSEQRVYARTDQKYGTWSWEPFEITFDVPEQAQLFELRMRRRKTNALDKYIAGKVWLDQFSLLKIVDVNEPARH